MTEITSAPDISRIEIPMDIWTTPFWQAAAEERLVLPCCGDCGTHRWPPGPFCPACRSQQVNWVPAGQAELYSYTILRPPGASPDEAAPLIVPGLVAFFEAGGLRIMAAIVCSPVGAVKIGAPLVLGWVPKGDTRVPVFSIDLGS